MLWGVFYSYYCDTTKTKTSEKLTTSTSIRMQKHRSLKPDEIHNPHICVHILYFSIRFIWNKSWKRPKDFSILCRTWYHLVRVFYVYPIEVVIIMLKVISLWKCSLYASCDKQKKRYNITQYESEHPYGQLPKAHPTDQFIFHLISPY